MLAIPPIYFASGIGTLLIVFGFAALISQRIYLDPNTQSPIEVELPMFGKMKANYPALVFVLLGFALTVTGLNLSHKLVPWYVSGTIVANTAGIKLEEGHLEVFPRGLEKKIGPDGKFTIEVQLEEGETFESVIQWFDYSVQDGGSVQIRTQEELDKFNQCVKKQNPCSSQLIATTKNSRTYEVHLTQFPTAKDERKDP